MQVQRGDKEERPLSPFLYGVGLMLTYRCNVACAHCLVQASPHRKEWMKEEDAKTWLKELRSYRNGHIKLIAITGGEPFFDFPLLQSISSYAQELGFIVTVVSNAFWASSEEKALQVLQELPSIDVLAVSTDQYHLPFIPIENICNAVKAAQQIGLHIEVSLATENKKSIEYKKLLEKVHSFIPKEHVNEVITIPVGRAASEIEMDKWNITSKALNVPCRMASFPVILPSGRISPCVGPLMTLPGDHALMLGNLCEESVKDIFDRAEKNILLQTIRTIGFAGLSLLLEKYDYKDKLPKSIVSGSICDFCYKMVSNPELTAILQELIPKEKSIEYYVTLLRAQYYGENASKFSQKR